MRATLHIAIFALLGPLVGTLAAVTVPVLFRHPDILDPRLYYWGYGFGVVPATLTGIVDYGLAKRQGSATILLIPLIGGIFSRILPIVLIMLGKNSGLRVGYFDFVVIGGIFALSGAAAAVVCHVLMRFLRRLKKA